MTTAWDRLAKLPARAARDTFTAIATAYNFVGGGSDSNVELVFDNLALGLELETEVEFRGSGPVADVMLDDLSQAPKQGDTLTLNGTVYEVTDVQLDARGNAVLSLSE